MTSSVKAYLLVTWVTVVLYQLTNAQSLSGSAECCSTYLMDATGLVAIETQRQLVTSQQTFLAARIRSCTNDPVAVQIWRRIDDSTFQFRWQTEISPVVTQISRGYITVNLGSSPLELTSEDRLAVFTPMSSVRVAVPFKTDTTASLYYSTMRYPDFNGFVANTQTTIDDLRWPRTLNASVVFCREAGCADQPAISTASAFVSTTTASVTGATVSSGPCCPTVPFSCDSTDVTNSLNNQTGIIIILQNTINIITKRINDLFSTSRISGTCPPGFTPGTYGVGKCYVLFRDPVQMAIAVLKCRDNFQARLLAIESVEEELFLKSMIGNNSMGTGVESYWTSGMYNKPNSAWYWYDESSRRRTTQVYRNWDGGIIPVPVSDADVCSTLSVDTSTNRDYWVKEVCANTKYYICEQPKTCL